MYNAMMAAAGILVGVAAVTAARAALVNARHDGWQAGYLAGRRYEAARQRTLRQRIRRPVDARGYREMTRFERSETDGGLQDDRAGYLPGGADALRDR